MTKLMETFTQHARQFGNNANRKTNENLRQCDSPEKAWLATTSWTRKSDFLASQNPVPKV